MRSAAVVLAPDAPIWRMLPRRPRGGHVCSASYMVVAVISAVEQLASSPPRTPSPRSISRSPGARSARSLIGVVMMARCAVSSVPHRVGAAAPAGSLGAGAHARLDFALTILAATLSGYIASRPSSSIRSCCYLVVGGALLVDAIIQEARTRCCSPNARFGSRPDDQVGLRRDNLEQFVVLVQGLARVAVLIVAAFFRASGRGACQSPDLCPDLARRLFRFHDRRRHDFAVVDDRRRRWCSSLAVFATRAIQNWLGARFLPQHAARRRGQQFGPHDLRLCRLRASRWCWAARGSGSTIQKFAIVAGALSVGIGFGLQSIVNNFVSGLILLWERGIRVGDWVVVGAEQGFVRRINARSTEIETFDRATLIVPNATLVTGMVKNWMHNDRVARIIVTINVAFESDPEAVREMLIAAAKAQDLVLVDPRAAGDVQRVRRLGAEVSAHLLRRRRPDGGAHAQRDQFRRAAPHARGGNAHAHPYPTPR